MCEVLDKMISEGYNRGISIGEARGRTEGISIGEARGRSEAKKEYEKELASLKARLAKYEAQDRTN